ncbi:hypothetical protein AAEX28_15005 [Lentisphaerota bacterium WC36G]|nr:hypothetical protein LJT99_01760 [Lentisphaerae bacterium WC36]
MLSSVKNSLLELTELGIEKNLLDVLFSAGAITTVATGGLNLPVIAGLLVCHSGLSFLKDVDKKRKQGKLQEFFVTNFSNILQVLEKEQESTDCLLDHILETELSVKELSKYLKSEFESNGNDLKKITENLEFQEKDLTKLLSGIKQLQNDHKQLKEDHKVLNLGIKEVKQDVKQLLNNQAKNSSNFDFLIKNIFNKTNFDNFDTGLGDNYNQTLYAVDNNIVARNLKEAEELLNRLEDENSGIESLTWINAFKGLIELTKGCKESALEFINESLKALNLHARGSEPHDILKIIYANVFLRNNNSQKALGLIKNLINDPNKKVRLGTICIWVELIDLTLEEIENKLLKNDLDSASLNVQLCYKSLKEEKYDKAKKYASQSIKLAEDKGTTPCYFLVANVIVQSKFGKSIKAGFTEDFIDKKSWADFIKVEEFYQKSLTIQEKFSDGSVLSIFYNYLAHLYFIVGDFEKSTLYIQKIFDLTYIDKGVLNGIIRMLSIMYNANKVIDICNRAEKIIMNDPDLVLDYLPVLLFSDRENYQKGCQFVDNDLDITNCTNIEDGTFMFPIIIGESYLKNNDFDKFDKLIDLLYQSKMNFHFNLLKSIRLRKKKPREAIEYLEKALDEFAYKNSHINKLFLNMIDLIDHEKKWQLGFDITGVNLSSNKITSATYNYLYFAEKLGNYEAIEKLCNELRSKNIYDWKLIQDEISVTLTQSPKKTEKLIKEVLKSKKLEDYQNHLLISLCISQLEQGKFIEDDYEKFTYPEVAKIDEMFPWCNVPCVLSYQGKFKEAVDYCYQLCQKFPNEKIIHQSYCKLFLNPDLYHFKSDDWVAPIQKISIDCSIVYKNLENDEIKTRYSVYF